MNVSSMDFKQVGLWGCLLVLAFLLVYQWNQDYGQSSSIDRTTVETDYPTFSAANGNTEINPASDLSSNAVASDIPNKQEQNIAVQGSTGDDSLPQVIDNEQSNFAVATTSSGSLAQFIRIKTDVMDVVINPVGGDIERVDLLAYPKTKETPNIPFTLLTNSNGQVYVAQSGLVGASGPDASASGRPVYRAESSQYFLQPGQTELVVPLFFEKDGVTYEKRFTFREAEYLIDVDHVITNRSNTVWSGNFFAQIKRDTSEVPSDIGMGIQPFLGFAYWHPEKPYNKIDIEDTAEENLQTKINGGWLALVQHYFVSAWIPNADTAYQYQTRVHGGNNIFSLTAPKTIVQPGQSSVLTSQFYAGPKILKTLEAISPGLDLTIDFGWLWFIAKFLFLFLDTIHDYVNNWGWAIIILTFFVKLVMYPLSAKSYRSMANMRRVQPEMMRLKELYGDDRQRMSQEMMQLYRKEKVNPFGGCLPILVQMPVFIALYWTLMESVELRQAEFMFWIDDLSKMDPLFVLPLIMGVTMWFQQKLNPVHTEPMQARVMQLMPIMFTFFFLFFPAGLVLYWVVNNVLSIAQQWVITKRIEAAA